MKLKEYLVLAVVASLLANIILYLTNRNEEKPPSYMLYLKNAGIIFVLTFVVLMINEKMPSFLSGGNKSGGGMTGGSVPVSDTVQIPSDTGLLQPVNTGEPSF